MAQQIKYNEIIKVGTENKRDRAVLFKVGLLKNKLQRVHNRFLSVVQRGI